MIRNGQGDAERKLLLNSDAAKRALWPVVMPEAIKSGTTPTLTFTLADGVTTEAPALTVVRASDTVNGIGGGTTNDRKRLTASGGGLAALHRGIPGVDFGCAYLITALDGVFAVQVSRIEASAIVLADEVPKAVVISADYPATVQWATWTATIPVTVTASQTYEAPLPWVVGYTGKSGADVPDMPGQEIHGFVHVVSRLFQTGLTHQRFVQVASGMWPGAVYNRLADWTPIIDQAFLRLVQMIRAAIATGGRRAEDDLDGHAFLDTHLHLTAALIRAADAAEYDRQIAEAKRLLDIALARVVNAASTPAAVERQGQIGSDLAGGSFGGTDTTLTGTARRVTQRIGQGW